MLVCVTQTYFYVDLLSFEFISVYLHIFTKGLKDIKVQFKNMVINTCSECLLVRYDYW